MASGPVGTLLLPKKFYSAITALTAETLLETAQTLDVSNSSYPHWEAWVEFFEDAAGASAVLPSAGTVTVTVSHMKTTQTGYDSYAESITNGDIDVSAPTRVNWSGRASTIIFDPGAGLTAGDATHFRLVAWGYHS